MKFDLDNVGDTIQTACECEDEANSGFKVAIWVDGTYKKLNPEEQLSDDVLQSIDFFGIAEAFWIESDFLAEDEEENAMQCFTQSGSFFRSIHEGGPLGLKQAVTSHILNKMEDEYFKRIDSYPWVSLDYYEWEPKMKKSSRQDIFIKAFERGANADEMINSLKELKKEYPKDRFLSRVVSQDIAFINASK